MNPASQVKRHFELTSSDPIREVWLAIAVVMTPEPDSTLDDIKLLVEAIIKRQKIPRVLPRALREIKEASQETTERIFFDCGGPSSWAAYVLIELSTNKTGHVVGR